MDSYLYSCYGLIISSTIPCPELQETTDSAEPDILVTEGKTPAQLTNPNRKAARFSVAERELLLEVDGIARFWVRNGNQIVVEKSSSCALDDVRVFLYGTAFGAALLQQGRVPLHATTITNGSSTLAFAGPSGAGKSTIAYTFLQRGWKLVADDVSALSTIGGKLHAQPAFPSIKLWRDVLETSQFDVSTLKPIRAEFDKYRWNVANRFHSRPALLSHIIGLFPHHGNAIEIEKPTGVEKFKYLTHQTYRRQMIDGMADRSHIFGVWAQTLDQVDLWHIKRPQSPMDPAALADAIEKLLA